MSNEFNDIKRHLAQFVKERREGHSPGAQTVAAMNVMNAFAEFVDDIEDDPEISL